MGRGGSSELSVVHRTGSKICIGENSSSRFSFVFRHNMIVIYLNCFDFPFSYERLVEPAIRLEHCLERKRTCETIKLETLKDLRTIMGKIS